MIDLESTIQSKIILPPLKNISRYSGYVGVADHNHAYMKVVVDALIEKGIRDDYIILVGGAPLNEAFAESQGADAYCRDAAVAVETAKEMIGDGTVSPRLDSGAALPVLQLIARGALASELLLLIEQCPPGAVELTCLPASWHNHPERFCPIRTVVRRGGRVNGLLWSMGIVLVANLMLILMLSDRPYSAVLL